MHPGTQPGDIFKLKDKGVPHLNMKGRGDQYVRITIEVPRSLTSKQKDILKQFDEASSSTNYPKGTSFFDRIKKREKNQ